MKAATLAQNYGIFKENCERESEYAPFSELFGDDIELEEIIMRILPDFLDKLVNDNLEFDFEDMIWRTCNPRETFNEFPAYHYIFVDEVQDLNPAQVLLLKKVSMIVIFVI